MTTRINISSLCAETVNGTGGRTTFHVACARLLVFRVHLKKTMFCEKYVCPGAVLIVGAGL